MVARLPRIVFVLGKGGVGRSTVAASLGLALARRGERVLVVEWTIDETIAPWFGAPKAGAAPRAIAPRLSTVSYDLDEALRAYFVDHLHLRLFYRHIVHGPHVRRLIAAAPGIAEMLFLGQLWWLTTLAADEAGLAFDRIVVDAPATGHGASLLDLPATLLAMRATGLLGLEIDRVVGMMRDAAWTGALLVAIPEELAVCETRELAPRATAALGRKPIAAIVNRSVAPFVRATEAANAIDALSPRLSPDARAALETLRADLVVRARFEATLARDLERATDGGVVALDDRLVSTGEHEARAVVEGLAHHLDRWLGGAP